MRRITFCVVAGASLAIAAAVLYRCALSEEARANVRKTAGSVRDACHKVEDLVSSMNENVTDPENLPNRRATAAQWEALGY